MDETMDSEFEVAGVKYSGLFWLGKKVEIFLSGNFRDMTFRGNLIIYTNNENYVVSIVTIVKLLLI